MSAVQRMQRAWVSAGGRWEAVRGGALQCRVAPQWHPVVAAAAHRPGGLRHCGMPIHAPTQGVAMYSRAQLLGTGLCRIQPAF
jgi:hypothetical protein